jgi:thiamine pyrophosphate-dependent acetolactate synthase large subunit-like protein
VPERRLVLGLGTRFAEADCSSWEKEYTFNFGQTKLIHIDIDPSEIGRNYPVRHRCRGRPEASAQGADPRRQKTLPQPAARTTH